MSLRHSYRSLLLAISFAAALCTGTTALAAPPSEAQVRQLLQVTRVKEKTKIDDIQRLLPSFVVQNMREYFAAEIFFSDEERARIDAVLKKFNVVFSQAITWEKVEPILIKQYADTFDANDVQAILQFYQSPAGQKITTKTPLDADDAQAALQFFQTPTGLKLKTKESQIGQDMKAIAKKMSEPVFEEMRQEMKKEIRKIRKQ